MDQLLTLQRIYIYDVELISGLSLASHFMGYYLGQVCFIENTVCRKRYNNMGFDTFWKKSCAQQFQGLLSGPSWPFLCCDKLGPDNNPHLSQIITPENAKLGPSQQANYIYIYCFLYIYIYIYRESQYLVQSLPFFKSVSGQSFVFFFRFLKIFFVSAGRIRFIEQICQRDCLKLTRKLGLVELCCATYLEQILTQPWTRY